MSTLRETVEGLRDDIIADMDRGYIPGPEFLARLRVHLDEAINRDTLENIGRCTRNDWCRAGLDHEGECVPIKDAEQIFDFYSSNGLVKVEILKPLGQPARCQVRHNEILLFDGKEESVDPTYVPTPTPLSEPVTNQPGLQISE